MRKSLFRILAHTITLIGLFCSCEQTNEEYRYPSVLTNFVCFITNSSGQIVQMRLDDNCTYPVNVTDEYLEANNREPIYNPDTLYRAISVYELTTAMHETVANIYSIGHVASGIPITLPEDKTLYQAPVYLQSIWTSGGYLNFVLEIKALDGSKHSIAYIDTTPEGMNGKEFTFFHHVGNDVESYRQKFYGSIPLIPFSENLQQGDTLRFVVNTHDKGQQQHSFEIK